MSKITALSFFISIVVVSFCQGQQTLTGTIASKDDQIVCKPITVEQMKRMEILEPIVFKQYEKVIELPDAMEYVFADSKKYASILLEFMTIERDCCPSTTMSLKFEPSSSKVSLILGGSQKLKERYKP
jgi:hypothetical protein